MNERTRPVRVDGFTQDLGIEPALQQQDAVATHFVGAETTRLHLQEEEVQEDQKQDRRVGDLRIAKGERRDQRRGSDSPTGRGVQALARRRHAARLRPVQMDKRVVSVAGPSHRRSRTRCLTRRRRLRRRTGGALQHGGTQIAQASTSRVACEARCVRAGSTPARITCC